MKELVTLEICNFLTEQGGNDMCLRKCTGKTNFVFSQCKQETCQSCTKWQCPVKKGTVRFSEVEPFIVRFAELREKSRFSKNPDCYYGDCDDCQNVSCGIWHGLALEPVMPEELKAEWDRFWNDFEVVMK